MMEVNVIKELYKGHFQVILDFPQPNDLKKILRDDYKYVWAIGHRENRTCWSEYTYTLYGQGVSNKQVKARNIEMEFLIETNDFVKLIPFIKQTVKIIQTNIVPPSFMDMNKISGKGRYDMLKNNIDYLFELEMPGAADYAPIVSPDLSYLETLIKELCKGK